MTHASRAKIRAEAPVRRRHTGAGTRADVPEAVRDRFRVAPGDTLVFEEGSAWAAERAAARGAYFVVTVERGVSPSAEATPDEEPSVPPPPLDSFAEAVRRKQRGG